LSKRGHKIEAQQLRHRHGEVREAMRVHRQFLQLDVTLPHGAFDGSASLAGVQHNRLVVDDAPLVQHVRICPDGVGSAAGIETRIP
jgi:hypothetical protein